MGIGVAGSWVNKHSEYYLILLYCQSALQVATLKPFFMETG